MMSDWKGVLVSIGIAIGILIGVWQMQSHYYSELRTRIDCIDRRLDNIDRRLARVEGVLSVRELPLPSGD